MSIKLCLCGQKNGYNDLAPRLTPHIKTGNKIQTLSYLSYLNDTNILEKMKKINENMSNYEKKIAALMNTNQINDRFM